ncbi:MAG: TIGR03915 family putative DNA repair protein [Defluviitaleaceae bacterium]|nr:TIGR03915 family putative DNA repair protein [Defluviitaleaceae bacterium]
MLDENNVWDSVPRSFLFDGCFNGFLSIIHAIYYEKIEPCDIQVEGQEQLSLGVSSCFIETNDKQAERVYGAIRHKISEEAAEHVYRAFHSEDDGRFLAIMHYIRLGFRVSHMVDSHLQESFVRLVHKLSKNVWREAHLLYGFCRFSETTRGAYYCEITPKNDVLIFLVQHFCERLMNQAWVIHDKTRHKAAIYDGNSYVIAHVPTGEADFIYADGEKETQELWTVFFNTLAIKERNNPKVQRNLLPLHYRKNMTEFKNS